MKKYRDAFLGWIAFIGTFLSIIEFYLKPIMEDVAKEIGSEVALEIAEEMAEQYSRKESHKVLYIHYSDMVMSYSAIPNPQPHHAAMLEGYKSKRDLYKDQLKKDFLK